MEKLEIPVDVEVVDVDLDEVEVFYRDERLTEARAEQIAAQSLRELRTRNLIAGRKSLSGDGSHSPKIQYRVPADIRDRAVRLAEQTGQSVSRISRIALEEYLERHAG